MSVRFLTARFIAAAFALLVAALAAPAFAAQCGGNYAGFLAQMERDAQAAVHAVATSPLVKTALNGGDPNWGRILAAVGRSGARLAPKKVSLHVGSLALVKEGRPAAYRESDAARIFRKERVPIRVDLGVGRASAFKLAADFGHDYISVNTDYRT